MAETETNRPSFDPQSSLSPESFERLSSPSLRMAWLLRTGALVSIAASVLGSIVVPGLRGLASDAVITRWEHVSAGTAYVMGLLLVGLLLTGALDLMRAPKVALGARAMIFFGASGVVAMLVPAFTHALTVFGSLLLVVATLFVVIGAAAAGIRAPHTRALALVQLALGIAAACRLIGWGMGTMWNDSLRMYSIGRTFSAGGIIAEGVATSVCVTWLSTRRRMSSSIAAAAAILAAFMLVWLLSRAEVSSPVWQNMLRAGITEQVTPGVQATLRTLEAFFITASILLALACVATRSQLTVVVCGLALALLGRGAFDVPLRALAASVAGLWTALAAVDERAMWRVLRPPPQDHGR